MGSSRGGKRQPGAPWTVKELAQHLRVSEAHIYTLVNEGTIQGIKVGATVRITDAVVKRLLGQDRALSE